MAPASFRITELPAKPIKMNMLAHNSKIALQTAMIAGAVDLLYVRGETELQITGIAGDQSIMQSSEWDNLIRKRHRESFVVSPSDLLDTFGEPQVGDQLLCTPYGRPDILLTFTLRADDSDPCFRPTDRFHLGWRLNTILTGKEAVE